MTAPDPRLTPARPDLAARYLQGRVPAARFTDGRPLSCCAPKTWLRRRPAADAPVETELLFGEDFMVYETSGGWCWGQSLYDGYVGYVSAAALGPVHAVPTHRVTASSTFVYAAADMKSPVVMTLPMNARVAPGVGVYAPLPQGGFIFTRHTAPLDATADDFVQVAERFLGVPYLWGGRTPLGFDCSGLVQTALDISGVKAPRDTDMQQAALGDQYIVSGALQGLRRGDLIFWKGHVGIMRDAVTLLHANAHHMSVASEPLAKAVARIHASSSAAISAVRRLPLRL